MTGTLSSEVKHMWWRLSRIENEDVYYFSWHYYYYRETFLSYSCQNIIQSEWCFWKNIWWKMKIQKMARMKCLLYMWNEILSKIKTERKIAPNLAFFEVGGLLVNFIQHKPFIFNSIILKNLVNVITTYSLNLKRCMCVRCTYLCIA